MLKPETKVVGSRTDRHLTFCKPPKSKQKSASPAVDMIRSGISVLAAAGGGFCSGASWKGNYMKQGRSFLFYYLQINRMQRVLPRAWGGSKGTFLIFFSYGGKLNEAYGWAGRSFQDLTTNGI